MKALVKRPTARFNEGKSFTCIIRLVSSPLRVGLLCTSQRTTPILARRRECISVHSRAVQFKIKALLTSLRSLKKVQVLNVSLLHWQDLSYKDKHWHEACFLCAKCRVSLVDKQFGSKLDKIYCGNCYDAQFASRCDGCGEVFRAGECTPLPYLIGSSVVFTAESESLRGYGP